VTAGIPLPVYSVAVGREIAAHFESNLDVEQTIATVGFSGLAVVATSGRRFRK